MKKIVKKLFFVFLFFLISLNISSCNKQINVEFEEEINIYKNDSFALNGVIFESKNECSYINDEVLKYDFKIDLINKTKNKINLNVKNPIAYGNDSKLEEEILESYDENNYLFNKLFKEKDITLDKNDEISIDFILIIQDGNPLAKYRIDFEINNVNAYIYSYEEGKTFDKFIYIHDPLKYNKVLEDAEYDENAVFGFIPNETGSLKGYRIYNWTNLDDVLTYKEERIKYVDNNDKKIKELENNLIKEGKSIEEIAKACSNLRNEIRLDAYKDNPEGEAILRKRNLERYGHEEGPLPEELYALYGSWETVLEKCYSTNPGMDACCGVYDLYFYLYKGLAYKIYDPMDCGC